MSIKKSNRGKPSLERRIFSLIENIFLHAGANPIVFLDSGALIDFDSEARRWRLVPDYRDMTPERFYLTINTTLAKSKSNNVFFMTPENHEELQNHYENHFLNGRSEVSRDTFEFGSESYLLFRKFMENIHFNENDFDRFSYDLYWASKMAFGNGHKKSCLDCISLADKELLNYALYFSQAITNNLVFGYTGVCVISPDSHILETIKVISGESHSCKLPDIENNYNYKLLKGVSSR